MAHTNEELKDILQRHIGGVYRQALEATGSEESAKAVTKRVMVLLKRADSADMAITEKLVFSLTEDALRDSAKAKAEQTAFENGVIAGMPRDFDAALSSLSQPAEPALHKKREAEPVTQPARERQEYVDPFKPKRKPEQKREKGSALRWALVVLAGIVVLMMLFVIVVLLIRLGLLPGANAPFIAGFAAWFNANVFILF